MIISMIIPIIIHYDKKNILPWLNSVFSLLVTQYYCLRALYTLQVRGHVAQDGVT